MCFEISGKIEQEMRSSILTRVAKTQFVFMLGRTIFEIVWVNFAKNQEKRRKSLNEYLPVTGEKLDKTKKIVSQKALF